MKLYVPIDVLRKNHERRNKKKRKDLQLELNSKRYERITDEMVKCFDNGIIGSERHKRLIKIERKLYIIDVKLRHASSKGGTSCTSASDCFMCGERHECNFFNNFLKIKNEKVALPI